MNKNSSATVGVCVCFLLAFAARAGGSEHDGREGHESSCSGAVTLSPVGPSDACPAGGVKITTGCTDKDDRKGKDKDDDPGTRSRGGRIHTTAAATTGGATMTIAGRRSRTSATALMVPGG